MKNLHDVLRGPCLTEKASLLRESHGEAVFRVHSKANKIEIKRAVEEMFNVRVKNVRTASMHGKKKRAGRVTGYTGNWKKAYVTLSEGEINFTDQL